MTDTVRSDRTHAPDERILCFDRYQLDLRLGCLRDEDDEVKLRPKGFALLCYLVDNAGRLVSKDELISALWADVVVTDEALSRCVSDVRLALKDHRQQVIKTVPRRGYVFAAAVSPRSPDREGYRFKLPLAASGEYKPEPDSIEPRVASAAETGRTNLPSGLGPLIGRDIELCEVVQRLEDPGPITIVGPAGVGKTRLALAVGAATLGEFREGLWVVDLAAVSDPLLVDSAAVTAIGAREGNRETAFDALSRAIGAARVLLIFDNCEHVAEAAAILIAAVQARCARIKVLATSQIVLGLAEETVYRLEPLELPPAARYLEAVTAGVICEYAAVQLFNARVSAVHRRYRFDDENAAGVGAICRALEGIPLALEMAAAKVPHFGIEGVRQSLATPQRLLTNRSRTGPARHRSIQAMLDWSYGLLDPDEQRLFCRLGIFRGSFSLEATLAVGQEAGLDSWVIAERLGRLIDKSLVVVDKHDPPRYRLLETLRLHADERLRESGERDAIAERHAIYYNGHLDRADAAWQTMRDEEWSARYASELDNARAALDWALPDPRRAAMAIALAGRAGRLWYRLALLTEGRHYVDRAVDLLGTTTTLVDAALLLSSSALLWRETDRQRGLRTAERAINMFRQLDDPMRLGTALANVAGDYIALGRIQEAERLLNEAWSLLAESSHKKSCASIKDRLANVSARNGNYSLAKRYYLEALRISKKDFAPANYCRTLINIGDLEFQLENIESAIQFTKDAIKNCRELSNHTYLGMALTNAGVYSALCGADTQARQYASEALPLLQEQGGRWLRVLLHLCALLAASAGQLPEATNLEGFVAAGNEAAGEVWEPTGLAMHSRVSELVANKLSDDQLSSLHRESESWTEEAAIELTRRVILMG
jgi:predicted ATPase/DNA-binding winged helix-turn-helix (wHTH) protein